MTSPSNYQYAKIGEYLHERQLHKLAAFLTRHETDASHYQSLLHSAFRQIMTRCKDQKDFSLTAAELLIDLGLNIDDYTASTEHLLSVTIRSDAPHLFDFLIDQHINLHNKDFEGKTPLYVAAIISRKPEYVAKLIKRASISPKNCTQILKHNRPIMFMN